MSSPPPMKRGGSRSVWNILIGVGVSVLLVWWVLRDVDPRQVWTEIRAADLPLLAVAVVLATSGFLIRAMRWKVFLDPIRREIPLRSRWAAVNIGFGLNNVLPWRMGELARVWSLSRLERVPMSATLGSLVVERVLDAAVVVALLVVAVLLPGFPDGATVGGEPIATLARGVSGVAVLGLVVLLVLLAFPGTLVSALRGVATRARGEAGHALAELVESFLGGLDALRAPALLLRGSLWTMAFWMWNAVSYFVAMRAFGIEEGYVAALFVQSVVTLGVAIPAAPGYVGTFQAAAVIALHEVYGAAEGATLAFAFGFHFGGFLPVTILGIWYANRVGVTLAELEEAKGAGGTEAGAP